VSHALLVLERTILKSIGCKCVAAPVEFSTVVWVRVECKRDLNASRSLLVLQRTMLKGYFVNVWPPVQFGSVVGVRVE